MYSVIKLLFIFLVMSLILLDLKFVHSEDVYKFVMRGLIWNSYEAFKFLVFKSRYIYDFSPFFIYSYALFSPIHEYTSAPLTIIDILSRVLLY